MPKIYRANKRGQISLGKFLEAGGYYMATVDEDDRVILVKVIVQPMSDLTARMEDPSATQAI